MPVTSAPASASELAALLGGVLLRPLPTGRFAMLGGAPAWFGALWPGLDLEAADLREVSLFLDAFLHEAAAYWAGIPPDVDPADPRPAPLASGVWTEAAPDGTLVPLEALALRLSSGPALLLRPPVIDATDYQHALQQSREQALSFDTLRRDFQQQEDALACLLHDMGTPLASLRASLQFLHDDGFVASEGAELLAIAQAQVQRLQTYVRSFLDTVSAPSRPPMPLDGDFPDLRALVAQVTVLLAPAFQQRRVRLLVDEAPAPEAPTDLPSDGPMPDAALGATLDPAHQPGMPLAVVAERVRLERVLANLLDNALRHSPEGASVRVTLAPGPHVVHLSIADDGPGVPEAFQPHLFRRYARGPGVNGTAGLGLYFCRTTVEGWGGEIGYAPAPSGGACFWVRLARPVSPALPPRS